MGWWRIDPNTGKPAKDAASKLSRPPDFVLLNAVPGADDDTEAHYLGDGPWDMVYSAVTKITNLLKADKPTAAEARALFMERRLQGSLAKLPPESTAKLLRIVEQMWDDVDGCYDDDWERPALPAEKRWVGENAVRRLTGADT
jgi:hypothetical protein